MIFGNTKHFAIEFTVDENSDGQWLLGRACYWLCSNQVGDYNSGTLLRDLFLALEYIRGDKSNRMNDYLFDLSKEALVTTLHNSMFGSVNNNESLESRALDEQWAKHNIRPDVDIFDRWKIFLVENGNVGRCVYYGPSASYEECWLSNGEYDSILSLAIESFNQNHSQLPGV